MTVRPCTGHSWLFNGITLEHELLDSDTPYNKEFYNISTTSNRSWLINVLQEDSSDSNDSISALDNYKKLLKEHRWKKNVACNEVSLRFVGGLFVVVFF